MHRVSLCRNQPRKLEKQRKLTRQGTIKRKHGVSFEQASCVFLDPIALTVYDEAHSDYEERWNTLGLDSQGRLLVIAHTYQQTDPNRARVRLISARIATNKEQRCYEYKPN